MSIYYSCDVRDTKSMYQGKVGINMELLYSSTRNADAKLTASQAILKGISDDGGLFLPERVPVLDKSLKELSQLEYKDIAYEVMKLFFTDFTEEELKRIDQASKMEK